jgi:hypothetical protein
VFELSTIVDRRERSRLRKEGDFVHHLHFYDGGEFFLYMRRGEAFVALNASGEKKKGRRQKSEE